MYSSFSIWLYSVNGCIFPKNEKGKYMKLFLFFLVHLLYIWNFRMQIYYHTSKSSYEGISGMVLKTCQAIDMLIPFSKLVWNYIHSRKFRQFLDQQIIRNEIIRKKYIGPRKRRQGFWLSAVVLFVVLEFMTLNSHSDIYWILPVIKDSLEYEFMICILGKLQESFLVLNKQMSKHAIQLVNMQKLYSKIEDIHIKDIEVETVEQKIPLIREISLNHYHLVNLAKDLNRLLSLNVLLIFTKNVIDVVHEAHGIIRHLMNPNTGLNLGWIYLFWILFTSSQLCSIIYLWNSVAEEANKISVLLHDIWNIYANKNKFHKKLIYLQLVSMRFLTTKLKFTAYGFFTINWSVLLKVVYSAAMYLIILVQLKK